MEHQAKAIEFLREHDRAGLMLGMGLGPQDGIFPLGDPGADSGRVLH
jgi:hypothetical protein